MPNIRTSMDLDLRWGDMGGYTSGGGRHNTTPTPTHQYAGYCFVEPQYIVQRAVPMVTAVSASTASTAVAPVTTTGGSNSRRTLTDDDRRRMYIEKALANWAKNKQIKGEPLNDSKLQEQAQRFAVTADNPESRSKLTGDAWLEMFKQKYNILCANGIHVVDSNTTSFSETPNSYTPVSSYSGELAPPPTSSNQNDDGVGTHRSDNTEQLLALSHFTVEPGTLFKSEGQDESKPRMTDRSAATPVSYSAIEESLTAVDPRQMTKRNKSAPDIHSVRSTSTQPPPVPPLPRLANTSPVSLGSPTQDDATRALDLVRRFFRSQPAGSLEPDEYAVVGKLMVKLFSLISEGTAVLPGEIEKSFSPSVSTKRKVEALNDCKVM